MVVTLITLKMVEKRFGTEMYDKKYAAKEASPRSNIKAYIDEYFHEGDRCLDLGCGEGRHAEYMASRGIHVAAIDRSHIGVDKTSERLKRYPGSEALVGDVQALPFLPESFDAILSNRVLDYNDDAGLQRAFAEIARVTKEGARVVLTLRSITQPSKANEQKMAENERGGVTYRVTEGIEKDALQHYFTESEIRNLAERNGFTIVRCVESKKSADEKFEWEVVLCRLK